MSSLTDLKNFQINCNMEGFPDYRSNLYLILLEMIGEALEDSDVWFVTVRNEILTKSFVISSIAFLEFIIYKRDDRKTYGKIIFKRSLWGKRRYSNIRFIVDYVSKEEAKLCL